MSFAPDEREVLRSVHDFVAFVRFLKRFKWAGTIIATILSSAIAYTAWTVWSVADIPDQVTRLDERLDKFDARLDQTDQAIASLESLKSEVAKLDQLRIQLAAVQDLPATIATLRTLPDELKRFQELPKAIASSEEAINKLSGDLNQIAAVAGEVKQLQLVTAGVQKQVDQVAMGLGAQNRRIDELEVSVNKHIPELIKSTARDLQVIQLPLTKPTKADPLEGGGQFEFMVERAVQLLASRTANTYAVHSVSIRSSLDRDQAPTLISRGRVTDSALVIEVWTDKPEEFSAAIAASRVIAEVRLTSAL